MFLLLTSYPHRIESADGPSYCIFPVPEDLLTAKSLRTITITITNWHIYINQMEISPSECIPELILEFPCKRIVDTYVYSILSMLIQTVANDRVVIQIRVTTIFLMYYIVCHNHSKWLKLNMDKYTIFSGQNVYDSMIDYRHQNNTYTWAIQLDCKLDFYHFHSIWLIFSCHRCMR